MFSPLSPPEFCVQIQERVNGANLSFYTPFFFFFFFLSFFCLSPPHTLLARIEKCHRCRFSPFAEEPLMEPCLTLQRGVFNQCDCPAFSRCVCVLMPLEPEGGLLMAAAMAMAVMMRWQWRCSHAFWLSSPRYLKDSLR